MKLIRTLITYTIFPLLIASVVFGGNYWSTHYPTNPAIITAAISLLAVGVIMIAEGINPYARQWNKNQGDLVTDIIHAFVTAATSRTTKAITYSLLLYFSLFLTFIPHLSLWPNTINIYLQLILALLIAELGSYWIHRTMHSRQWAWKFHATHHSSPRLYWLNAARFHPVDVATTYFFSALPLIILGANTQVLMLFTLFAGVFGTLQHCNINLKLGPLNYFFSMAEVHRWHHSKNIREASSNYGDNLIVWDLVFGTYYNPKNKKAPIKLGLATNMDAFPSDYLGQLLSPLNWNEIKRKSIK